MMMDIHDDQWVGFGVLQNTDNYWIKMDNGEILKPVTFDSSGVLGPNWMKP